MRAQPLLPQTAELRGENHQGVAERLRVKARRAVETLEEEVAALEERIREIDAALADPAAWKDGPRTRELTLARDGARRTLDERFAAWEEAVKRLEEEVPA